MQCVGSVGIIAVIGEVGDWCVSSIPCKEEEEICWQAAEAERDRHIGSYNAVFV